MKEMFEEMAVKKNVLAIPKYYHPDFLMVTNQKKMNYMENLRFHEDIYKTDIQYQFRFEPETVVEKNDRIAFRFFVTTKRPSEPAHEIEVMLIGQYKAGKIYRIWELTYPDWSKAPAFNQKH